jgi:hypothetical protein
MTMMGEVGLGFGAGVFVLAYLLAVPLFLLNLISAKWGFIGAFLLLVLNYVPRAIQNWPQVNPFALMNARGDRLLVIIFVLNLLAGIAQKIIESRKKITHLTLSD